MVLSKKQRSLVKKLHSLDNYLNNLSSPAIVDMSKSIIRDLEGIQLSGRTDKVRLKNLLVQARKIVRHNFDLYEAKFRDEIVQAIVTDNAQYQTIYKTYALNYVHSGPSGMFTAKVLEGSIAVSTGIHFIPPELDIEMLVLRALDRPFPVLGSNGLKEMWRGLQTTSAKNVLGTINKLYLEGVTSVAGRSFDELNKSIIDKALVNNVITENGLRKVRVMGNTLFHTTVSVAREEGRAQVEKEYQQYIKGFLFDAHLDQRTTRYCREHNQRFYPVKTRAKLAAKGIQVPAHWNCRSLLIAIPID